MDIMPHNDAYFYLTLVNMDVEQQPNPQATEFFRMIKDVDEPLWERCEITFKVSYLAYFFSAKA